jgi:DNA-binding MarR family transcriptional regulator
MKTPQAAPGFHEPIEERIVSGLERISTALRQRSWRQGFSQELTPTQGNALLFLARFGASTLGALAESLGVRPSTASEAVATLEEKGLVERQRAAEDRRRLEIDLTPPGREAAHQASAWPGFLVRAVGDLTPAEQGTLLKVLQKMLREMQESGAIPVARLCVTCRHFRPFVHDDDAAPHHCAFVDLPFGNRDLRLDCPEHQPASAAESRRQWARLHGGGLQ